MSTNLINFPNHSIRAVRQTDTDFLHVTIFVAMRLFFLFSFVIGYLDAPSALGSTELLGPHGKILEISTFSHHNLTGLRSNHHRLELELDAIANISSLRFKILPWTALFLPNDLAARGSRTDFDFELKEAWIEWTISSVDFRFGNQIFTWGAADQINPTDVMNALDYRDPFASPRNKIPVLALTTKVHPESIPSLNIEFVAAADLRSHKLPIDFPEESAFRFIGSDQNRWLIPLPQTVSASGFEVPLYYRVQGPDDRAARLALGTRISLIDVSGWDFSWVLYTGVEKIPRFSVSLSGQPSDPNLPLLVTLAPSYHRMNLVGFDGATNFKLLNRDFGFRYELATTFRSNAESGGDPDLTKDAVFHAVVGLDHTFPESLLGTVLYLNIQFVGYERIGNLEQPAGRAEISGLPTFNPWDRNFVVYIENRISDQLKVGTRSVWSLLYGDIYLSPMLYWNLTDTFQVRTGIDFFAGPIDGFYGQFKDNSRYIAGLSYDF